MRFVSLALLFLASLGLTAAARGDCRRVTASVHYSHGYAAPSFGFAAGYGYCGTPAPVPVPVPIPVPAEPVPPLALNYAAGDCGVGALAVPSYGYGVRSFAFNSGYGYGANFAGFNRFNAFSAGYGHNDVVRVREVVRVRDVRGARAVGNSGVVGIARAVVNTGKNLVGAVIGR